MTARRSAPSNGQRLCGLTVVLGIIVHASSECTILAARSGQSDRARGVGRTGEVELEGKVLVLKRIYVKLEVRAAPEHREIVERVHGFYADSCPLYRSLKATLAITSELELVE